jgi:hypothetical protein
MNWTKFISALTGVLVFLLFLASFILSYNALRGVAKYGISPELDWLWPLVIDGAIVVFALVVVYFGLINHNYVVPEVLVIVFTVITVLFNAIHAGGNGVSVAVAIMPPIALFLSFKMLMWIIKNAIERSEVSHGLDKLKIREDKLKTSINSLETRLDSLKDTIGQLMAERKTREEDLKTLDRQPVVIVGVDLDTLKNSPDKRQPIVRQLWTNGIRDKTYIGELLDISTKTVSRDVSDLNGNL